MNLNFSPIILSNNNFCNPKRQRIGIAWGMFKFVIFDLIKQYHAPN